MVSRSLQRDIRQILTPSYDPDATLHLPIQNQSNVLLGEISALKIPLKKYRHGFWLDSFVLILKIKLPELCYYEIRIIYSVISARQTYIDNYSRDITPMLYTWASTIF